MAICTKTSREPEISTLRIKRINNMQEENRERVEEVPLGRNN